jgi:plasmid maintenance system antidote protein VapI
MTTEAKDTPGVDAKNLDVLRGVVLATGRTRRELAAEIGIDHSTLTNILKGRRGTSAMTARRICHTLGVASHLFFDIEDDHEAVA